MFAMKAVGGGSGGYDDVVRVERESEEDGGEGNGAGARQRHGQGARGVVDNDDL